MSLLLLMEVIRATVLENSFSSHSSANPLNRSSGTLFLFAISLIPEELFELGEALEVPV